MKTSGYLLIAALAVGLSASAEFRFEEAAGRLTLFEDDSPVFVYNFGRVDPPAGVDAKRYWRSSYLHPVYGLDGSIITQDFPEDHYHHRGVFWTWPECRVGDRKMDVWTVVGVRQLFEGWRGRLTSDELAGFVVQNGWKFDDDPDAVVRETVNVVVHREQDDMRFMDFRLRFENVSDEEVIFEGAKNKGYGGFCFRPDAAHKPFTFVTRDGILEEDSLQYDSPWTALFWTHDETKKRSGVAIFQHPSNPDYPHDGWLLRHYGFIGTAWPHEQQHLLKPGEHFELQYRLVIFGEEASRTEIAENFEDYLESSNQSR